ncbi:MAG: hypothetical protein IRY99_16340 [Isosphaeraceae bacterium]|nr:hypothetical protein [Isosphaeraceae bacterium]
MTTATTTNSVPLPRRPARHWWRLVAWLLPLPLLAAAAVVAWKAIQIAGPHLRAAAALEATGAKIDWQWDDEDWSSAGYSSLRFGWSFVPETPSDADLRHLKDLHRLRSLDLSNCELITDAGLAYLKGLNYLRELRLDRPKLYHGSRRPGPRITDAGLVHLKSLSRLELLSLEGAKITDAGLANLSGLTALETLDLSGTEITDAGLRDLQGLPKLDYLRLEKTKVTREGVEALRRALPEATITSSFDRNTEP